LGRDLVDGESLLGASRVVVSAASSISPPESDRTDGDRNERWLRTRSERFRGRAARGHGSRHVRLAVARNLGFPLPASIFVLGLSDQRLLFWEATRSTAKPVRLAGSFPITEIASLQLVRRFGMMRLGVLLVAGPLLVVQPLWDRGGLEELAAAFDSSS
jgi:hypothetical protein